MWTRTEVSDIGGSRSCLATRNSCVLFTSFYVSSNTVNIPLLANDASMATGFKWCGTILLSPFNIPFIKRSIKDVHKRTETERLSTTLNHACTFSSPMRTWRSIIITTEISCFPAAFNPASSIGFIYPLQLDGKNRLSIIIVPSPVSRTLVTGMEILELQPTFMPTLNFFF